MEIRLRVRRQEAQSEFSSYSDYTIDMDEGATMLDALLQVRDHDDGSLALRYSCRSSICGSCAMRVNGRARLACKTKAIDMANGDEPIVVEPLGNMPVIKDLVTDMAPFFENWQRAGGDFRGNATRRDPVAAVRPDSAERRAADAGIECINCAVCHAACEVVARLPEYLGPAALNRAWTLVNDARHLAPGDVVAAVSRAGGCHGCHSHGSCAEHCPVEINPTLAIAGLKRRSLGALAGSGGP